jgi:hypothetical protein
MGYRLGGIRKSTDKHAGQVCQINQRLILLLDRAVLRFNDGAQPALLRPQRYEARIRDPHVIESSPAILTHINTRLSTVGRCHARETMHDPR